MLERGFAPRFLLEATVSRPQVKKGHLLLTLTDGMALYTDFELYTTHLLVYIPVGQCQKVISAVKI